jgi:hypothetical protein
MRCGFVLLTSILTTLVLITVPTTAPAWGHHSFSGAYDSERIVTLEGIVTRIDWVNPHAYFFIDVTDQAGTTVNWAVEFGNIFDLERSGWRVDTLRIGDRVGVQGRPARGTARQAFALTVSRSETDERLFTLIAGDGAAQDSPTAPRWPDGQVRLGPPPGERGYWGSASVPGMREDTTIVIPMNDDALLVNLSDAERVAPFQPWALALYERRQRRLLVDDPYTRCLPPGGPRQFHTPYGIQFVEQRDQERILVLSGGGNRNWRVIHMDGRPSGQPEEAVLTYYGTSTGRWEGDTLVVETVGFNERFWFSRGGLPHTEALRLTERFTREGLNTLSYEVRIDDPGTYTRPWTARWSLEWVADQEIQEFFCEENAESTFVR